MIKSIRIQNFKSLKDVSLDLQDINLFIGPNNSGKSNVLKALKFFTYVISFDTRDFPVNFEDFTFNNELSKTAEKNNPIVLTVNDIIGTDYLTYQIEVYDFGKAGNRFSFLEFFGISEKMVPDVDLSSSKSLIGNFKEYYFNCKYLSFGPFDSDAPSEMRNSSYINDYAFHFSQGSSKGIRSSGFSNSLLINMLPAKFDSFCDYLHNFAIYKPELSLIKAPQSITNSDIVIETGANLTSFIYVLDTNYPQVFDKLLKTLRVCIPEISTIKTSVVGENLFQLRIHENSGKSYLITDVSDGVVYFLFLLSVLHQPDPPNVILIEEPENGVHPRRIIEIYEFIVDLVEKKNIQVIITTHSPVMVDQFKDTTNCVFVFDKVKGETQIKNLDTIIQEEEKVLGDDKIDYSKSLGDHWTMGFFGGVPR